MSEDTDGTELVSVQEALQVTLQWHHEGRLAEAGVLYDRILEVLPGHPEALHFRGLLHRQLGHAEIALDFLHRALAARPDYADAWSNLGNLLQERGDLEGAETSYRRALALAPGFAEAHNNLGTVLRQRGHLDEAEQIYRDLIERSPDRAATYNNLGHLLFERGRVEDAIALLEEAVARDATFAEAFQNLGHALLALDRNEEAMWAYRRAVALGADAYWELGNALRLQGMFDEAMDAYREAIQVNAYHGDAYYCLGMLLSATDRDDVAADTYRAWLQFEPENPVAQHMLAACGTEGAPVRASDSYVRAIFDGFAPSFDRKLEGLEYRAPELVAAALEQRIGAPAADRVLLDAGCGTGLCAPLLRPFARRLLGVDLSGAMLERAHERGGYDELIRQELTAYLSQEGLCFDAIASADTLVYFGDLSELLTSAAQALRPGGCLIFTLEHLRDGKAGFRLNSHGRYSHSKHYVRAVLETSGFGVIRCDQAVLRKERGEPVEGLVVSALRIGQSEGS